MRYVSLLLLVPIIVGILLGPATFRLHAAHAAPPAPYRQTALAFVDVVLIAYIAALAAEARYRPAVLVLICELLYNLSLSIAYLLRGGITRFSNNVEHSEYLILYLCLIAIRWGCMGFG